jgi:hypothetical protein
LADQVCQKLETKLNAQTQLDIEDNKARATYLHFQYYSNNPIKYKKGASYLKDLVDYYGLSVKEQFLLYKAELHNWGKIQNYDYSTQIKSIGKLSSLLLSSKLSNALMHLNSMFEDNNIVSFDALYNTLISNEFEDHSELQTIINIYLILNAKSIWQKGIAKEDLFSKLGNLYEFAMQKGVYLERGKLSVVTFRNIVQALSAFNDFHFVENFIHRWIDHVNSPHILTTKNLAFAINCFYHEKYEDILTYTRMIEYNEFEEKTLLINLEVIAYFMNRENEYELFNNAITNFENIMKRNKSKFSEKYYLGTINLCDFMKKMDKLDKNKTIDLSQYEYLYYRQWCLKMLEKR